MYINVFHRIAGNAGTIILMLILMSLNLNADNAYIDAD